MSTTVQIEKKPLGFREGGTEAEAAALMAAAETVGKVADSSVVASVAGVFDKTQIVADALFKQLDKNKDGSLVRAHCSRSSTACFVC